MKNLSIAVLSAGILLAASGQFASAAVVDTIQTPTLFFVPDATSTYDSPYYRDADEDWGWQHNAILGGFTTADLSISAWDVDYSSGEVDNIYAYDAAGDEWLFLGALLGASDTYSYTTFSLGAALFDDIAAGLQVRMDIDANRTGWLVTLAKSVITTDGASLPPVDPGPAPVPLPATALLLMGGLGGLGALRRLRKAA